LYTTYWGLQEKPFENTPDPRMFYNSSKHEEALTRMLYVAAEHQGGGMLTGDYGSGKTILSRVIPSQLDPNKYRFLYLSNPQLTGTEFIREITRQVAVIDRLPDSKSDLLNLLTEVLKRNAEINRDTVVIVDDAQLIRENETLEDLRLLLNLQHRDKFLITLLFFGQTELREKINRLPQLKQRMTMRYHLDPLTEQETAEYVLHRLKVAGREAPLFTDMAIREMAEHSRGVPREINNICNWALLAGFSNQVDTINRELIEAVIKDMEQA